MEGTIGEIRLFASNFAPKNWAYCAAQVVQIRANTALFSILGSTYGGDGSTTFMLPDLQGRVAVGAGQGAGLTNDKTNGCWSIWWCNQPRRQFYRSRYR